METWKRFEETDTNDLINYYQDLSNPDDLRKDSFLALCFRFRSDLIKKCEVICKRLKHDLDVAIHIAENTFAKYGKTHSFKMERGNQSNTDDNFKIYLYGIAQNELKNYYKKEKKRELGLLYDGTEGLITEIPNPKNPSPEQQIIRDTLLSLPRSHQVVYLTYKVHERQGVNLPKKLQAQLREFLGGVEQSTVRGYKKEANDKVNAAKLIIEKLMQ